MKQLPTNGNPQPYSFKILGFVTGLIALIVLVTAFAFTVMQAQGLSIISLVFLVAIVVLVWLMAWGLLRALRGSEHKFRAIFEQAAVGMGQVAYDGRILDVNHVLCEILEYAKEDLLTRRYRDLVHPADWDNARQKAASLVAGEVDHYILEQRLIKATGSPVWVRLTVYTVSPPGMRTS